jgi:hypothetical protein
MATSNVPVTGGSGYNIATRSFTEDAATKQIQRVEINTSAGVEAGTAASPFQVSLANTGANATAVKVDGSAVTQPVSVSSIAAGDNNIGNVDLASAIPAGTNAIGKLVPNDIDVTTHTNYARKYYTSAGAVTDGIIWSPAAGKRWHVITLYLNVSAAATVTLEDDKAGGDDPVWKGELAANSGVVLRFDKDYPMASGEDAADLIITTSAGNVYCTVVGYEI